MNAVRKFLAELRRRKVYKVAVVYAAVAFVIWQIADIAFPSLNLPESAVGIVLVLTVLGFPLALVLAWACEVRPEEQAPVTTAEAEPALATPSPDAPPQTNSVVVLPFESMDPEQEREYFADGITEEITNVLAGLADLRVTARTSAFMFKGKHADIREIGQRLGVSYLVEGSVRRAGDTLRITAQLIDATSGYHIWSERFDRSVGAVFEIQDEIAGAVAERLSQHVRLAGNALRPVARSSELPAYDVFLKARQLLTGFAGKDMLEAAACFEESIALDSGFAAARAGLAEALTLQSIGFQLKADKETMPRARQEADVAIELDPNLPDAHLARALVAMYYEWDYRAAKTHFDRAVELGPNIARIHMWREFYFTYVEHDYAAAIAENALAQKLDPLDVALQSREATVRYLFGDVDEAEKSFRALLEKMPELPLLHIGLADTLMRQGRINEAVAVMEQALEFGGPLVMVIGILAGFYGLQGSTDKAQDLIQQLEARSPQGYSSSLWVAIAQAGIGDMDAAFDSLETARVLRDSNLLYIFFIPSAFGFHSDPRFPGVLRAIGLSHLIPESG